MSEGTPTDVATDQDYVSASPRVRLSRAYIENFRGLRDPLEIVFSAPYTLLLGQNGTGKSSALNAIEWCLFGSEIAKRGCGIDERLSWEVSHRGSATPVSVELTFECSGGCVVLKRTRRADAKKRDLDEVSLEMPGGEILDARDAAAWLDQQKLPDWTTWKHSFCQHQELVRARITDGGERSNQLGKLLGLEDYQDLRSQVLALKFGSLRKTATDILDDLAEEVRRSMDRPASELKELTEQLRAHGIEPVSLGEGLIDERVRDLIARADSMTLALGCDTQVPDGTSVELDDVIEWSNGWKRSLREQKGRTETELFDLQRRENALRGAIEGLLPSKRRSGDARKSLDSFRSKFGDLDSLKRAREKTRKERDFLIEKERGLEQARALLRHALEELRRRQLGDCCPVCNQVKVGLEDQIHTSVEVGADPGLGSRLEELSNRESNLSCQIRECDGLMSELESAEMAQRQLAESMRSLLPEGHSDSPEEIMAAASRWKRRIDELGAVASQITGHSEYLVVEIELLNLLKRWRVARAQVDAVMGDLAGVAGWSNLQAAIDEAACLASDLEAIGLLARQAQRDRSAERVGVVNQNLGKFFSCITSGGNGTRDNEVRIEVKETPANLTYRILDNSGADATPVLNQAALNALAFALLFSQAEERARQGLPIWVQLDDPTQSLDAKLERGLTDAVIEVSKRAPVIVATFENGLSDRLETLAAESLQVFHLPPSPSAHVGDIS